MSSSSRTTPYVSLYGNVRILKGYCESCDSTAFILDGTMGCCGAPAADKEPRRYKREVEPEQRRRRPSMKERERLLQELDNRCLYCNLRIGSVVWRNGRALKLRLNWDHLMPYSYGQNNKDRNFVPACHVCNGLKSNYVYQTIEEARLHIQSKREAKGYTVIEETTD